MIAQRLIDRCLRQERKAQSELYRLLYGPLMGICMRYERDRQTAMERLNQGFLKILTHLHQRRPEVPFEAWARRIMINTVIDGFRKERERMTMETDGPVEAYTDNATVNEYLQQMEAEDFAIMLEQVPAMSRRVFNLFAVDGYAHAEIAQMLGIREGTSKWHVAHARTLLQQALVRQAHRQAKPLPS